MSNENFASLDNTNNLIDILRKMTNENEAFGVCRLPDGALSAQVVFTNSPDNCFVYKWTLAELTNTKAEKLATDFEFMLISARIKLSQLIEQETTQQKYQVAAEHLAKLPKSIKCDWVKMVAGAMFEDGDVLLAAVPVVVRADGVASLAFLETRPRANEWQYELYVVKVDCDEDRFRLETHDGEPFVWDPLDIEYYVQLH